MKTTFFIDAWIEHIHIFKNSTNDSCSEIVKAEWKIEDLLKKSKIWKELFWEHKHPLFTTWKLAPVIIKAVWYWLEIIEWAALWATAKSLALKEKKNIWIISLSASGYMVISVDSNWKLIDDWLFVNPRCWAWSWVNLSRILQKLDIGRETVDDVLVDYLWEAWEESRRAVAIRADRCWVFSSSATVSDKNQWIPISSALATTMKSEVLKAIKKISPKVSKVYLTWRVFLWKYTQFCAKDYLHDFGIDEVEYDSDQTLFINWMKYLHESSPRLSNAMSTKEKFLKEQSMSEYPSFSSLFEKFSREKLYYREPEDELIEINSSLEDVPVNIWFDIGSTMAKIVISEAETDKVLFINSYDNHWDTIDTIKHIFKTLKDRGINKLNIQQIWITWSWRYQVKKALSHVYPDLDDKVEVLVENYAHARWSIPEAKKYIDDFKKQWIEINDKFYILVDVGWEDTKISVVSLKSEDLHENAMNIKCSAWTGSLMDTLRAMLWIESIRVACENAMKSDKSYSIRATCAVFLMENARIMQTLWYKEEEILASCYFAIVENMARTLWPQIEFPKNTLTLLHWQTMLSDPLPLAVTYRLQEYTWSKTYAYVPMYPWHRACIWLIKGMKKAPLEDKKYDLADFVDMWFERKILVCKWVACMDKNARCNRSILSFTDREWSKKSLILWWCTLVNEFDAKREVAWKKWENIYRKIWEHINSKLPKSKDEHKLVIPRSFAISEYAYLWSQIFETLGIPVCVDNVKISDILLAQPKFGIDTCAPFIWSFWQFSRLAKEDHWYIFIPQMDFLPTWWKSLWRTCTTNQWWIMISMKNAQNEHPDSNFLVKDVSLKVLESKSIASQTYSSFKEIFDFYDKKVSFEDYTKSIDTAIEKNKQLKDETSLLLANIITEAIAENKTIIFACWREYILNPWIYDSHVWRLFSDKWVVIVPSSALDIELNEEFSHIYWRNPHSILTIIKWLKEKNLSKYIKNSHCKEAIKKLEDKKYPVWVVFVSTFRCWPDTMMIPLLEEITKNFPILTIQSDAAINELAHLENRVNTYLKQIESNLVHDNISDHKFHISYLDKFTTDSINKDTDVLYYPTLEDNRVLSTLMRWAWFDCIDNYSSDNDLQERIKFWRRFTWDSVCAPFAAVFADTLYAAEDFIEKKCKWEFKWKTNVVIFNNKWTWPCRQWQYYESHRLLLYKELNSFINKMYDKYDIEKSEDDILSNINIKFIVWHEKNNYQIWLPIWTFFQSLHWLALQWVLHGFILQSWNVCKNETDYRNFRKDFEILQEKVFDIFENKIKPDGFRIFWFLKYIPIINLYYWYRISWMGDNNWFPKLLKEFSKKWNIWKEHDNKIKIHIEGEAYMRVAQIEDIMKALFDILWFWRFSASNSPIWMYFEYILYEKVVTANKDIKINRELLRYEKWFGEKLSLMKKISKNYFDRYKSNLLVNLFRKLFTQPLYKAANIEFPDKMSSVLEEAKELLPTLKPYWELWPYVWEALKKLKDWTDIFLNISPEWCMVASMWEMFTDGIYHKSSKKRKKDSRIQWLFSADWEINTERLSISILKVLGPEKFY